MTMSKDESPRSDPPPASAVTCVRCEHLNPAGLDQCESCNADLFTTCKQCGQRNARVRSRCASCQAHLKKPRRPKRRRKPFLWLPQHARFSMFQAVLLAVAVYATYKLIVLIAQR